LNRIDHAIRTNTYTMLLIAMLINNVIDDASREFLNKERLDNSRTLLTR